MADLFKMESGAKINPAWDGRQGADFYTEDANYRSVLTRMTLTLGEVEALRDRMAEIARQIHKANPAMADLPKKPRKR